MRVNSIVGRAAAVGSAWLAVGCGIGDPYEPAPTTTGVGATTTSSGGLGGSTTTSQGAGGAGAAGLGGTGGGAGAGAAGGCDAATTWIVTFPLEVVMVVVDQARGDLVLAHGSAGPERRFLHRVDPCTGQTLVSASLPASSVSTFFPKMATEIGGRIVVVGNGDPSVTTDRPLALHLDPVSLQIVGDPVAFPVSDESYGGNDLMFAATVGPDGAIWLSKDTDPGALWRYSPGSAPLYCNVGAGAGAGGTGIAGTPTGLVLTRYGADDELLFIDLSTTAPGTCPEAATVVAVPTAPDDSDARALATSGSITIAAGIVDVAGNPQAGLARYGANMIPDAMIRYPEPASSHTAIDAFLSVALDPPETPSRQIFLGGALEGTIEAIGLTGAAFVTSVPFQFNNAQAISPTVATTAKLVGAIARSDDAVFIGGIGAGNVGFVARCTRDLACPADF